MYRNLSLAIALGLALLPGISRAQIADLVADVRPGLEEGATGLASGSFLRLGDELIFQGSEPVMGPSLWATDGTATGTEPLLDACGGACGLTPTVLAETQLSTFAVESHVLYFQIPKYYQSFLLH